MVLIELVDQLILDNRLILKGFYLSMLHNILCSTNLTQYIWSSVDKITKPAEIITVLKSANFTEKKFKIYRESVNFTGKGVILQKRCKFYSVNFTDKIVYVALIRYRNFRVSCEHFFFHLEVKKGAKKDKNIAIHCIEKIHVQNYICSR